MKYIIIGLGSMGKRRMRILRRIDDNCDFICVDRREDRLKEAKEITSRWKVECKTVSDVDELEDGICIDAAFVCTAPLTHSCLINKCLNRGWNVFTEINLISDGYDSNVSLAEKKGVVLYLSSTPMFRRDIKTIINVVNNSTERLSYNYHVGQYLPDWHPWENYQDFFVGKKATNGCREILAIELPWLIKAFGNIMNIEAVSLRQTKLNIDYDDCYIIIIEHEMGHKGVFAVDVVSRIPIRRLEVVGENTYIEWNGSSDGLYMYNDDKKTVEQVAVYKDVTHQDGYNELIIEDDYEDEVRDFLEVVKGNNSSEYNFSQDKIVLDWIDKIENV